MKKNEETQQILVAHFLKWPVQLLQIWCGNIPMVLLTTFFWVTYRMPFKGTTLIEHSNHILSLQIIQAVYMETFCYS